MCAVEKRKDRQATDLLKDAGKDRQEDKESNDNVGCKETLLDSWAFLHITRKKYKSEKIVVSVDREKEGMVKMRTSEPTQHSQLGKGREMGEGCWVNTGDGVTVEGDLLKLTQA